MKPQRICTRAAFSIFFEINAYGSCLVWNYQYPKQLLNERSIPALLPTVHPHKVTK